MNKLLYVLSLVLLCGCASSLEYTYKIHFDDYKSSEAFDDGCYVTLYANNTSSKPVNVHRQVHSYFYDNDGNQVGNATSIIKGNIRPSKKAKSQSRSIIANGESAKGVCSSIQSMDLKVSK